MNKIYHTTKDKFIVYNACKSNKKNMLYVIFLHGFMSSMDSTKAVYLENYCREHNANFIRFDNFGHGLSSERFLDCTISDWLEGLELVLDYFSGNDFILVGSSMGGWLSLLAAPKYPKQIKGLLCIAPAPDFTEESIWNHLAPMQKEKIQSQGFLKVSNSNSQNKYPISYNLILDARQHLLLNKEIIEINLPIHLIHGIKDEDVSADVSYKLLQKLDSEQIVLKLIKDGDHRLSRPQDLKVISHSLGELIGII